MYKMCKIYMHQSWSLQGFFQKVPGICQYQLYSKTSNFITITPFTVISLSSNVSLPLTVFHFRSTVQRSVLNHSQSICYIFNI